MLPYIVKGGSHGYYLSFIVDSSFGIVKQMIVTIVFSGSETNFPLINLVWLVDAGVRGDILT